MSRWEFTHAELLYAWGQIGWDRIPAPLIVTPDVASMEQWESVGSELRLRFPVSQDSDLLPVLKIAADPDMSLTLVGKRGKRLASIRGSDIEYRGHDGAALWTGPRSAGTSWSRSVHRRWYRKSFPWSLEITQRGALRAWSRPGSESRTTGLPHGWSEMNPRWPIGYAICRPRREQDSGTSRFVRTATLIDRGPRATSAGST